MKKKDSFTTSEVAKICRVSTRIVTKWSDTGRLKGYKLPDSKHRRFTFEQIKSFMEECEFPMEWLKEASAEPVVEPVVQPVVEEPVIPVA